MTSVVILSKESEHGNRDGWKACLDSIVVGCVGDSTNEWTNLHKVASSLPKLDGRNWTEWSRVFRTFIQGHISYGRGIGLLEGTAQGSIPAYQRYFGTRATSTKEAALTTEELASQARDREESNLAIALYSTVEASQHLLLVSSDPTASGKGSTMWKELVKKFTAVPMIAESVLTSKLENFVPNPELGVGPNIDQLKVLFRDLQIHANSTVSPTLRVHYLLKMAMQYPGMEEEARQIKTSYLGQEHGRTFDQIEMQLRSIEQSNAAMAQFPLVQRNERLGPSYAPRYGAPVPPYGQQQQPPMQQRFRAIEGNLAQQSYEHLSTSPTDSINSYASSSTNTTARTDPPSPMAQWSTSASEKEQEDLYHYHASQAERYGGGQGRTQGGRGKGPCFHCGNDGHVIAECEQKKKGLPPRDAYRNQVRDQERTGYRAPGYQRQPVGNVWLPGGDFNSTYNNQGRPLPSSLSSWDTLPSQEEIDATHAAASRWAARN